MRLFLVFVWECGSFQTWPATESSIFGPQRGRRAPSQGSELCIRWHRLYPINHHSHSKMPCLHYQYLLLLLKTRKCTKSESPVKKTRGSLELYIMELYHAWAFATQIGHWVISKWLMWGVFAECGHAFRSAEDVLPVPVKVGELGRSSEDLVYHVQGAICN